MIWEKETDEARLILGYDDLTLVIMDWILKSKKGSRYVEGRHFNNWVIEYTKYTKETEPPVHYHVWTGIFVIASALQRKCWLQFGRRRLFPNLYVIFVSPPGKCRKGAAITLGVDLLKKVTGVTVTSDSTTREQLIRHMASSRNDFLYFQGGVQEQEQHCSLTAVSKELGSFLGVKNTHLITFLTDIYDCDDVWEYSTKNRGTDKIIGACLNFVGAITPDWLARNLPMDAIGGGYSSRVLFVVGRKKAKRVTIPPDSPELQQKARLLVEDLERISTLTGPFTWDPQAYAWYDAWYQGLDDDNPSIEDPRFQGYIERKPAMVLKTAMCLSAAKRSTMVIEQDDVAQALALIEDLEPYMSDAFGGLGAYDKAVVIEQVMKQLMLRGQLTFQELMRLNYRDIDEDGLQAILHTLRTMGEVDIVDLGGVPVYRWKERS